MRFGLKSVNATLDIGCERPILLRYRTKAGGRAAAHVPRAPRRRTDESHHKDGRPPSGRASRDTRRTRRVAPGEPRAGAVTDRDHPRPRQGHDRSRRASGDRDGHSPRHPVCAHDHHRRRGAVRAAPAAGRPVQGRHQPDRLQELLADRDPDRGGPQRARRRDARDRRDRGSGLGGRRRDARRDERVVALAHGRPERGLEPAARQPRPLPAAEPHRRRQQQRRLELARRSRAAHHDQRLRPCAGRQRQLPARRRQQHRGPAGDRQPGAEPRGGAGVPRHHEQLRRRVRPLPGGRRRRRHEVGHKPVPRRSLRVLPEREPERDALGAARRHRHQGPAQPQPVRRRVRRPAAEGPHLLLRQLLGLAPGGDVLPEHRRRSDRARARGGLLAVGEQAARSLDGPAVPRRRHSGGALRSGGAHDPGALRAGLEPAQQLLRGEPSGPAELGRGEPQAGPPPEPEPHPRAQLLLPEGHGHAAALAHRQHPVGRPRLQVDAAQREPERHLDREPLDHQSAPCHLRAAVRRPRQQPDDLARRSELELHGPG